MMAALSQKTKWFYLSLASAVLAIIAIIYGLATKGFPGDFFSEWIVVTLLLGIAVQYANIYVHFHWVPILSAVCYGTSFGLVILYGAPTVADKYWGITYSGGNFNAVLTYLVLTGIAMLLAVALLFFNQDK
jgi:hypothetical protein